MPGAQLETLQRRTDLLTLLKPPGTSWSDCHTIRRLQEAFPDHYANSAGLRKLQRDIKELIDSGYAEAGQRQGGTWRYRRARDDLWDDSRIRRSDTTRVLFPLLEEASRSGRLEEVWHRVLIDQRMGLLTREQLLVIPDHLQLQQVRIPAGILHNVVSALIESHPVEARYQKKSGEMSEGKLHPQALIQRGPIPYLLAIKDGEREIIKHFPLHRMQNLTVLAEDTGIRLPNFDLQEHIAQGHGDFGQGDSVDLQIRARGYIAEILQACPLTADQTLESEPDDPEFEIRVSAKLPSTGSLWRWLLAAGANIEVIEPEDLRASVGAELRKGSRLYSKFSMQESGDN